MNLCPKKYYILHHSKTENKYTQCLPAFGKWVTDFETSSSIIASEITENFRLREEMPLFFIKYFICRLFTPIASAITGIDNLRSNEYSKLVKTQRSVTIYYLKVLKVAPCQSLLFQLSRRTNTKSNGWKTRVKYWGPCTKNKTKWVKQKVKRNLQIPSYYPQFVPVSCLLHFQVQFLPGL